MIEINKMPYESPKNTFKVIHEWMIGDADGTEYTEQLISKDNKYLEKYLECWSKLIKPLPGKIGNVLKENTISKILGEEDAKWFNSLYYDWDDNAEDDIQDLCEDCFFRTETDLGFYSYRGFVISYFDENGLEYGAKYTNNN